MGGVGKEKCEEKVEGTVVGAKDVGVRETATTEVYAG